MVLTDSILDLRASLDFRSGRDLTVLPRSPNEPRQCSLAIIKSVNGGELAKTKSACDDVCSRVCRKEPKRGAKFEIDRELLTLTVITNGRTRCLFTFYIP